MAAENFQKGRLARAIWTDNPDAFALRDSDGNASEKRDNAISFGEALSADDGWQGVGDAPEDSSLQG
jgi:hypothetical protein